MSLARARTRTARSGDERTNHEATTPPTYIELAKPKSGAPGLGSSKPDYAKLKISENFDLSFANLW